MTGEPDRAMRALVTGANGGLGSAIAERLRADGLDVRTADLAEPADFVLDLAEGELPAEALAEIDVCVSNAGIVDILSPAHRMSPEKWERDLAVNLTGSFRVIQACLGGMRERGFGRIVAMSSIAAAIGAPGQVAYSASKAGLVGMIRTIAAENAGRGITANAILPGVISTPKAEAMPEEIKQRLIKRFLPSGRFGTPEEVGGLVSYLASRESAYVTGQAILIDGGSSLNQMSLGSE